MKQKTFDINAEWKDISCPICMDDIFDNISTDQFSLAGKSKGEIHQEIMTVLKNNQINLFQNKKTTGHICGDGNDNENY